MAASCPAICSSPPVVEERQHRGVLLLRDLSITGDVKAPVQLAKDALVDVLIFLHADQAFGKAFRALRYLGSLCFCDRSAGTDRILEHRRRTWWW